MKRYFAFYGDIYYPSGGMSDFVGDFDSLEEAVEAIKTEHHNYRANDILGDFDWGEVWDSEKRIEVFSI